MGQTEVASKSAKSQHTPKPNANPRLPPSPHRVALEKAPGNKASPVAFMEEFGVESDASAIRRLEIEGYSNSNSNPNLEPNLNP